ncbi:MAG: type II secretion system protein [Candidatus Paceibacterota bacterium]
MHKTRGFTLIELLVVIAIIGILASVVLASLNTARDKGSDAAIKSNLNNARAQSELYYDDNDNSYSGVCTASSTDSPAGIADFEEAADGENGDADCDDSADEWAMEAILSDGSFYCVDSSGAAIDGSTGTGVYPTGSEATRCTE